MGGFTMASIDSRYEQRCDSKLLVPGFIHIRTRVHQRGNHPIVPQLGGNVQWRAPSIVVKPQVHPGSRFKEHCRHRSVPVLRSHEKRSTSTMPRRVYVRARS